MKDAAYCEVLRSPAENEEGDSSVSANVTICRQSAGSSAAEAAALRISAFEIALDAPVHDRSESTRLRFVQGGTTPQTEKKTIRQDKDTGPSRPDVHICEYECCGHRGAARQRF